MDEDSGTYSVSSSGKKVKESFRQRFSDFTSRNKHKDHNNIFNPISAENAPSSQPIGVPISSLEPKYQNIFNFPYFNIIQSQAFNASLKSNQSMVISSPTGSGKTAVLELAIIKVLREYDANEIKSPKIIYMAPVKALCNERNLDWSLRFGPLGVKCLELTGDTDVKPSDLFMHMNEHEAVLMLTTPEKWDAMTRKWKDYGKLVDSINLFLIDEVHLLNENRRGPTLETVVSRMRTTRLFAEQAIPLRFVACSATIPNAVDVAEWLGTNGQPALLFQLSEDQRPVHLTQIILGYTFSRGSSLFKFDMSLNYKLPELINKFSDGKPTLIFCTTRKSVQQTATYLANALFTQIVQDEVERRLLQAADTLQDPKIRETIVRGVGFHHAGLSINDRKIVEYLFLDGYLPVLVSTSTLALGVNLPAHLVIIKSTTQMVAGADGKEYSAAQLLQMAGRAGRPQFDKTATAVIMTKSDLKDHYEELFKTGTLVESRLHLCLKEHLNAEITLGTITDVSMAVAWLQTTFLFVRALKEPPKYGIRLPHNDQQLRRSIVEQHLFDLCLRELNALNRLGLIVMQGMDVFATPTGKLMAHCYITFDTMALFSKLNGQESLPCLLETISSSTEFNDIQLRVNERKALNSMNRDKTKVTIRFPLPGRIVNRQMKVNCLIQAVLGCLTIADPTLSQETAKVMRLAHRLSKCLVEYLWCQCDQPYNRDEERQVGMALLNAIILTKCLRCGLWENSPYVSKQIEGIGLVLSRNLVEAGYTTFESLGRAHPRDLEKILNRTAPFGSRLITLFQLLPQYSLSIEQSPNYQRAVAQLKIVLQLLNWQELNKKRLTVGDNHTLVLIVLDASNRLLLKSRIKDTELLSSHDGVSLNLRVNRSVHGDDLVVHVISESWVGLDISSTFSPIYTGGVRKTITGIDPNQRPVISKVKTGNKTSTPGKVHGARTSGRQINTQERNTPIAAKTSNDRGKLAQARDTGSDLKLAADSNSSPVQISAADCVVDEIDWNDYDKLLSDTYSDSLDPSTMILQEIPLDSGNNANNGSDKTKELDIPNDLEKPTDQRTLENDQEKCESNNQKPRKRPASVELIDSTSIGQVEPKQPKQNGTKKFSFDFEF